ncbi:hypothetical protein E1301_Tti003113 [Triplophysa tibetana]|uniref:Uncharacterized protein n=1 Tax=Triplophysa tibetana TaxID=1572043 RepID=A0A5A9PQD3_9TELE|nr:hypothetical protein E1301_Tti003113 [Triplophysa tibetana]
MSLSVSQGKGVTVFISKPKSRRPTECTILGNLCYSPAFLIPPDVKKKAVSLPTILGILQIIVGLLNIITGILFVKWGLHDYIMKWDTPFWLGGEFVISGIMTMLVANYPSYFLFTLTVILNEVSALLAILAVGLYSWDLENSSSSAAYGYSSAITPKHRREADPLMFSKDLDVTVRRILDIMMIVSAILQLCMNVTFVVPSLKKCARKNSLDDPQLHKLLPEEITANPAC